jgi:hypothetical protein
MAAEHSPRERDMIEPMVMQHFSDLLKIHRLATYWPNFITRTNAVGLAIHAPRASASDVIRLTIFILWPRRR